MAVEQLTAIGWGLVVFAVIVGVGIVVLQKLADTVGAGAANTTITYIITQLGSTGLAGWIPVVIVILIAGLVFLMFGNKGKMY
jgi:hypothetical protein